VTGATFLDLQSMGPAFIKEIFPYLVEF